MPLTVPDVVVCIVFLFPIFKTFILALQTVNKHAMRQIKDAGNSKSRISSTEIYKHAIILQLSFEIE